MVIFSNDFTAGEVHNLNKHKLSPDLLSLVAIVLCGSSTPDKPENDCNKSNN